jgi:hypothetical protein
MCACLGWQGVVVVVVVVGGGSMDNIIPNASVILPALE